MPELDETDGRILELLQECGTATNQELADQLNISASQLSRRISRLRESGIIRKTVALLSPDALGLDVKVYVMVTLKDEAGRAEAFHQLVRTSAEIVECCSINGNVDFILKIYARDVHALQILLTRLMDTDLVQTIKTNITIATLKQRSFLRPPLERHGT